MCTFEAQAALQIASVVMNYQNKKNVAKQHAADNRVAEGHYNEAYLYDLSKIDNESGIQSTLLKLIYCFIKYFRYLI